MLKRIITATLSMLLVVNANAQSNNTSEREKLAQEVSREQSILHKYAAIATETDLNKLAVIVGDMYLAYRFGNAAVDMLKPTVVSEGQNKKALGIVLSTDAQGNPVKVINLNGFRLIGRTAMSAVLFGIMAKFAVDGVVNLNKLVLGEEDRDLLKQSYKKANETLNFLNQNTTN